MVINIQALETISKKMVVKKLSFDGIVADKHTIGSVPGASTSLIVISIIAAAGFTIPKSSDRATTTPSSTVDDMEVLAGVTFTNEEIYKIVAKANGCIIWGESSNNDPHDLPINLEEPLSPLNFDEVVVSVMTKKIAFGANHMVLDIPYGEMIKVHSLKDAHILKEKFEIVAKHFSIKLHCMIHHTDEPLGRGIGPLLETREVLKVLEKKKDRPLDLELRSLQLAAELLKLCLEDSPEVLKAQIKSRFGNAAGWATHLLSSGEALTKLKQIITAQKGDPSVTSEKMEPGKHSYSVKAHTSGRIHKVNSKNATILCKILGAPADKKSGMYLEKKNGQRVEKGDIIYTIYSENEYNLKEAKESLRHFPICSYY